MKDVDVAASLSLSMAVGDDGDHAEISDDLSRIGEGSDLGEVQDSEELYDCIEDHYADEDNLMQGVDYMNYNNELHANNYIYYYHRSVFLANDDDPSSNLGARNDVAANIDCLSHQSDNDRRNYVGILPLIPMSQYDNACVAISHRSFRGSVLVRS
jgi:hypothetical protein